MTHRKHIQEDCPKKIKMDEATSIIEGICNKITPKAADFFQAPYTLEEIWKDVWIPGTETGKETSTQQILSHQAIVQSLIDESDRSWDSQLKESIFNQAKAEIIKNIALPWQETNDIPIWK
ncbi:hypothetical protein VNO77_07193 [Canavalia gladiata]|uniref:Uncharacterized protein n=1 Tax=Canavalia gladiata TaxID=3824 RepID=A0AAN9QWI0_CANGL